MGKSWSIRPFLQIMFAPSFANEIYLSFDLVRLLFYFLSEEEYLVNESRDQYGRLTFERSKKEENAVEYPIVNMWAKWIDNWVIDCFSKLGKPYFRKKLWPGDADIAISFSHDVDIVNKSSYRYWRTYLYFLFTSGTSIGAFLRSMLEDVQCLIKNGHRKFSNYQLEKIKSFNQKQGIRATFNIMTSNAGLMDNEMYLDLASNSIVSLNKEGNEIGLHGGFQSRTYSCLNAFIEEKQRLEDVVGCQIVSTRQHYLGFDPGSTFIIQETAGILVDSTVTYPDKPGFKSGFAHPYNPWIHNEERRSQVSELALIMMDSAMMSKLYAGLNFEQAINTFLSFFNMVKAFNGVLTINWHQRIFFEWPL